MIRIILTIVLIGHGLVHLIGFVVPWRQVTVGGLKYTTTVLAGRVDIGTAGIRLFGLFWLVATVGYVVAGIGVFTMQPWWQTLTLGVTLLSLVLCLLALPDTVFGALINLAILGYLFYADNLGWLPIPR
jgi:hypothetical protein